MMTHPVPFSEFCERVLRLYRPPIRARSTRAKMAHALHLLAMQPGIETTADITTDVIASLIASREDKNVNSTLSILRAIRAACRYAHAEGWIDRPPQFDRLMPRKVPSTICRHYAREQLVNLLEYLRADAPTSWRHHRIYAMAATVLYTGLRRDEAACLKVEDVRLKDRVLFVVPRSGNRLKTVGSEAPVPIAEELLPILADWMSGHGPGCEWLFPGATRTGPWRGGSPGYRPGDWLKRAGAAVDIENLTWHALRHTLAKLMIAEFGCTAEQVKSVLRHADIRTTEEHYLHRDDRDCLVNSVRNVSFRPAAPSSAEAPAPPAPPVPPPVEPKQPLRLVAS
jgi:integrase